MWPRWLAGHGHVSAVTAVRLWSRNSCRRASSVAASYGRGEGPCRHPGNGDFRLVALQTWAGVEVRLQGGSRPTWERGTTGGDPTFVVLDGTWPLPPPGT
jgi:hypothetical protein